MNQFKRAQVIMLPTLKESILLLNPTTNKFGLTKETSRKIYPIEEYIKLGFIPQHLYIISDDEIKEGDYVLNIETNNIFKSDSIEYLESHNIIEDFDKSFYINSKYAKKIIATTDKTLSQTSRTEIPQPSQQFIEKYIEEYNNGNIITDILVEYEQDYTNRNCSTCNLGTDGTCELNLEKKCCSSTNNVTKHGDYWISCLDGEEDSEIYKIKVASKDNTITIKQLKDSWNREEVRKLLNESYLIGMYNANEDEEPIDHDEWMDKNL